MKKLPFLIIIFISFAYSVFGQDTFVNKQYGFAMREPKDWIRTNKTALIDNLAKFELDDAALAKLLKDSNGRILLAAYQKHDPHVKPGLIPTIQIQIRSKSPSTYKQFEQQVIRSIEQFNNVLDEHEIIGEPKEVEISGIRSLLMTSSFIMKTKEGRKLNVRSRTYAIPLATYFFQLNFTDGDEEECSSEFDALVKTIKIGREP